MERAQQDLGMTSRCQDTCTVKWIVNSVYSIMYIRNSLSVASEQEDRSMRDGGPTMVAGVCWVPERIWNGRPPKHFTRHAPHHPAQSTATDPSVQLWLGTDASVTRYSDPLRPPRQTKGTLWSSYCVAIKRSLPVPLKTSLTQQKIRNTMGKRWTVEAFSEATPTVRTR